MFWKKSSPIESREWKNLLRQNLDTISLDLFSSDDPILLLNPEERKLYLKRFNDLVEDKVVIERIKYLANLQSRMTLSSARVDGDVDKAGAFTINGICVVKEDIERLKAMYDKENAPPEVFNKFDVI